MGKAANVLLTALCGAAAFTSFVAGNRAYRKYVGTDGKRQDTGFNDREEQNKTEWEMEALDKTRLYGALYAPDKESHDYVVLLGDYESTGESLQKILTHYRENGMQVLVPDPRGLGKSRGHYIGYGYDDRLDVIGWIHRILHTDPKAKIAIHGLGTGAATALLAGAEHLPGAVYAMIADSSYTTLSDYLLNRMKHDRDSVLPAQVRLFLLRIVTLVRAGFDIREASPVKAVEKTNVPTLFLHGDEDKQMPVEMCRILYRRAACTRQIGVFLGAGHLQSLSVSPERYFSQADAFLAKQHPDRL